MCIRYSNSTTATYASADGAMRAAAILPCGDGCNRFHVVAWLAEGRRVRTEFFDDVRVCGLAEDAIDMLCGSRASDTMRLVHRWPQRHPVPPSSKKGSLCDDGKYVGAPIFSAKNSCETLAQISGQLTKAKDEIIAQIADLEAQIAAGEAPSQATIDARKAADDVGPVMGWGVGPVP